MRLAENKPTSPQSFIAAMRAYTGSENWFYVDHKNIAVLQSGWFPRHARGTNPDLPIWGTGRWDWRGFNPASRRLPAAAGERQPGRRSTPSRATWSTGTTRSPTAGGWPPGTGRADPWSGPRCSWTCCTGRCATDRSTWPASPAWSPRPRSPPICEEWPSGRGCAACIGRSTNPEVRQLVALLTGWARGRIAAAQHADSNVVDDSPAVLLMDEWWPTLVRAEFQPVVGAPLMSLINSQFNSISPDGIRDGTGNGFFAGWEMDVQKDLRQVLHQRVRGRFSRTYCGRGSLRRCRALLSADPAAGRLAACQSIWAASMANWKLPLTCPVESRRSAAIRSCRPARGQSRSRPSRLTTAGPSTRPSPSTATAP